MVIAVSFLKSKLDRKNTIFQINHSNADLIHVDLMDGEYVYENNFNLDEIINDLKDSSKPLDFHLMVNNPEKYISEIAKLKPSFITIHLNTTNNLEEALMLIKDYNIKVGIAINPEENIQLLDDYFKYIDYVLLMSVYPGRGGQIFIKDVLKKALYLKNKNVLIGIDGGINNETIKELKDYNFDIIVSGSYVCMSDNYNEKISILKGLI